MAVNLMPYVAPSWLLWIVAGVLLHTVVDWKKFLPTVLREFLEYGKLRSRKSAPKSIWSWISPSLPKRWFTHFYIWGVVWNYSIFLYYTSTCILDTHIPLLGRIVETVTGDYVLSRCSTISQPHFDVLIVLFLICVQVSRRLYECFFVHVFSDSQMGIVHYVLGVYFYTAVGLAALLHLDSVSTEAVDKAPPIGSLSLTHLFREYLHWQHVATALLFLWASKHQYSCHVILANLRKNDPKTSETSQTGYGMPKGDWFEYVSSPHFFAEILIYFALSMCFAYTNPMSPMWLTLLSTFTSLSLSARQAHHWYLEKFEDYPQNRRVIVPWIY